ncbi:MAG: hypothetical protein QM734_06240 [Cyclobacteriaceae bacterium]
MWTIIEKFFEHTKQNKFFNKNRANQNINWFHENINSLLKKKIIQSKSISTKIHSLEKKIERGEIIPSQAAVDIFKKIRK